MTVRHFRVPRACRVSEFLNECLNISNCESLFNIGAVYHGRGTVSVENPAIDVTRLMGDVHVEAGDYIRVHPNPRYFEVFPHIDWRSRIVGIFPRFCIVNKPAGIPSHATTDNRLQNCLEGVRSCLGIPQAYLPQRLDIDTSGLMIVCTSKDFLAQINRTIASRGVIKRYRALLASDKECSVEVKRRLLDGAIWEAHLMKTKVSPKIFQDNPTEDSLPCSLKVVSCSPSVTMSRKKWMLIAENIYSTNQNTKHLLAAVREWMHYEPSKNSVDSFSNIENSFVTLQEVQVELITGRTHQVRGQAMALGNGFHVAGDNLYKGATSSPKLDINSICSSPYLALQATSITLPKEFVFHPPKLSKAELKMNRHESYRPISFDRHDEKRIVDSDFISVFRSDGKNTDAPLKYFELATTDCWWLPLSEKLEDLSKYT